MAARYILQTTQNEVRTKGDCMTLLTKYIKQLILETKMYKPIIVTRFGAKSCQRFS